MGPLKGNFAWNIKEKNDVRFLEAPMSQGVKNMLKLVRRNVAGLAVNNWKNGDAGAATFAELINSKAREPSYGGGQGGQNTPLHEERKFLRVGVEKL